VMKDICTMVSWTLTLGVERETGRLGQEGGEGDKLSTGQEMK